MRGKKRIPATAVFPEAEMMPSGNDAVTDPQGSYTGRTVDPFEHPVQDADDL